MLTVAVTGANGLVGRHLSRHFRSLGWTVRALVRRPESYQPPAPGVAAFACRLPEEIDGRAFQGADAVVHCAYATRIREPAEARRVNEDGTQRLLAAARQAGVGRFIFVSSIAAAPDARSYYGRSKYALEQRLNPDRDLALRPGLVLANDGGLFQRMAAAVRRFRIIPILTTPDQVIQTVHVHDLCVAFERAIGEGLTGRVTVAEPGGLPLHDLLRLVAARLERRCVVVRIPIAPLLLALRVGGRLPLKLPITADNLLGLLALRHVPTEQDLRRLRLRVQTAAESIRSMEFA